MIVDSSKPKGERQYLLNDYGMHMLDPDLPVTKRNVAIFDVIVEIASRPFITKNVFLMPFGSHCLWVAPALTAVWTDG